MPDVNLDPTIAIMHGAFRRRWNEHERALHGIQQRELARHLRRMSPAASRQRGGR